MSRNTSWSVSEKDGLCLSVCQYLDFVNVLGDYFPQKCFLVGTR